MDSLPALPLDQILAYLDVSDLLSCSMVSIGWRAAVNIDHVWKRICYKQCNRVTVDYVRSAESRVEPTFLEPRSTQKQLGYLCYWRIVYMKLQHVNRNWRSANHHTYNVIDLAFNHFDLKVDNNLLVANVNDNQCEVWNIKGYPQREETIVCALKNTRCKCMIHVYDERIVIVQDTLLQVYGKIGKRYRLSCRRLFNQPETDSQNIPGSLNVDEWYSGVVKRRPSHLLAFHVGKYFIGMAQNGTFENASFHVWDVSTGSKLKEESVQKICPEVHDPVHNVKFCTPRTYLDSILVCVQHSRRTINFGDDVFYTAIHVYDLTTLTFRKLKILKPHVPWIYYEDHLILTIGNSQSKLSIFNSSTGERLVSKRYEEILNPDSVQVHGDYLGFTTGGDLVVLNVKDFELVFTTAILKFSSNLFGFDFVFLDWNLVLIARFDGVNKIEVWNVKEKRLLNTLKASGIMFSSNNSAKFFVWNEMITTIYMLQFW